MNRPLAAVSACLLLGGIPVSSQVVPGTGLPPEIRRQIHQNIPTRQIMNLPGDADLIWTLRENPRGTQIVELRVFPNQLQVAQWDVLRDWIRQGGACWIYTGYLNASQSGASASEYLRNTFGMRLSSRGVASEVVPAANQSAMAAEILTDVQAATSYVTEIVLPSNGVPLLVAKQGGLVASGIVPYGRGFLVLYLDVNRQQMDGERFYVNLREFSAHYPVPRRRP